MLTENGLKTSNSHVWIWIRIRIHNGLTLRRSTKESPTQRPGELIHIFGTSVTPFGVLQSWKVPADDDEASHILIRLFVMVMCQINARRVTKSEKVK